jgi:hypothetical protein
VAKREAELVAAIQEYRKCVGRLLETIAAWQWDDPISQIYRELFKAPMIVDPPIDRDSLLADLEYRYANRIPPGYKDSANEHSGIGDFLIWKTILKIGETESRHLVFVSGDEKTDWRYQSENRALYPRIELLEEYRAASKGKSLLMITFAELLQQFGASQPVVEAVRQEEAVASLTRSDDLRSRDVGAGVSVSLLHRYLKGRYPDRDHATPPELVLLLQELKSRNIETLEDLEDMIAYSTAAFDLSEAEAPPQKNGESTRFNDMGVVRRSLAIMDEAYRMQTYPSDSERFRRWRREVVWVPPNRP